MKNAFEEVINQESINVEEVLSLENGNSLKVKKIRPDTFIITDYTIDGITDGDNDKDPMNDPIGIGLSEWDSSVEDMDNGHSDIADIWGMSNHIKWEDVEIDLSCGEAFQIKAPSIDRIKEALKHVKVCGYCPSEI
jgi:hypothetical protein